MKPLCKGETHYCYVVAGDEVIRGAAWCRKNS